MLSDFVKNIVKTTSEKQLKLILKKVERAAKRGEDIIITDNISIETTKALREMGFLVSGSIIYWDSIELND